MDDIIKHLLLVCYQSCDFVVVLLIILQSLLLIMILIDIHVFGQIQLKNVVMFVGKLSVDLSRHIAMKRVVFFVLHQQL